MRVALLTAPPADPAAALGHRAVLAALAARGVEVLRSAEPFPKAADGPAPSGPAAGAAGPDAAGPDGAGPDAGGRSGAAGPEALRLPGLLAYAARQRGCMQHILAALRRANSLDPGPRRGSGAEEA